MSRTDAERLEDIHAAIARCMAYRDRLDSAEFGEVAHDAILRNPAVIGEAVKALPDDFKREHADTPWPSIAGLRNVVTNLQRIVRDFSYWGDQAPCTPQAC